MVLAVVFAAAALWVTLRASFLAYPGWLAVQKADFIVGPIGVGLYWRHRRPNNRLGLILIALGLAGIPYILESSTPAALFGFGVPWEMVIVLLTEVAILAFPDGRLDGLAARLILAVVLLAVVVPYLLLWLTSPQFAPTFSISGCRVACPPNGFAIGSPLSWAPRLVDVARAGLIVVALSTICVLVWRFMSGIHPRRRALAVGAPIALLFLAMQATYQTMQLLDPGKASASARPIKNAIDWTFAGARASVWYGFLFALIAAELFAGRALRELVGDSLERPSLRALENMLRDPLGDPFLRVGFWRRRRREWVGSDGAVLKPPGPDQVLTEVGRYGRPAGAIVHDEQLADDPELLQAAGTIALLAMENAQLEAAWNESLHELAKSRTRIAQASDRERRKLERDLHDGAQQRLLAALVRLSMASELATDNSDLRTQLTRAERELEGAIHELRELAHGIYPTVLSNQGLAGALRSLPHRFPGKVNIKEATERRFPPEIEAAVYYCCLEAIQNASKHAGPDAHAWIHLRANTEELHLRVLDNGPGFDMSTAHDGVGLQSMRDRLDAVGGSLEIDSERGRGTLVIATVPLASRSALRAPG